jgi:anionic cell wall polymer biosynthesis LytR-Cps2A-Psr (LCP) family protein
MRHSASRHEIRQGYRKARRHPWLRRGTIGVAAGLALILVLGVVAYFKLNSNITQLDVSNLLGKRPASSADRVTNLKPLNILVMGSDTRALGTNAFGTTKDAGGARSDTTLIVHLSGDRQSAVVISVPRDSMTRAPRDCHDPSSRVADGPIRQWNANFSLGGPACLIRTVEGNTGIFIDHFMLLDFLQQSAPAGRPQPGQRPAGLGLRPGTPQHWKRCIRPGPDQPPAGVSVFDGPGGHE